MKTEKFINLQKEADLLLSEDLEQIKGGVNSTLEAAACGACCQYALGGGSTSTASLLSKR